MERDFLYFHGMPDGGAFLPYYPNQFNVLISAYRVKRYGSVKRYLHHARSVFLDSGMISAWKACRVGWAEHQLDVIALANEVGATYCAHLDLPMEPHLLALNGVLPQEALRLTLLNAQAFMGASMRAKKVFVIQGYQLSEYQACIDAFRDFGILGTDCWLAIGSVCMRSPARGLYEVCSFIRRQLPHHHLHAFGVGRPAWIRELRRIGIDSFDSATGSLAGAFNHPPFRVLGRRTMKDMAWCYGESMRWHEEQVYSVPMQMELDLRT